MATIGQALNDLKAGYTRTVNALGTSFILKHTDDTTKPVKAHVIPAGKDDTAIVNSIGVDAVFLHCLSLPLIKKYDMLIAPSGREYIVDAVHEIYVNSDLIGQKVIAR